MPTTYDGFDGASTTLTWMSGFTCKVRAFKPPGESVSKLELTAIDDSVKRFKAGRVTEYSDMEVVLYHDPDIDPPLGIADTITIQYPPATPDDDGTTLTVTGFITDYDADVIGAGGSELVMATATFVVVDLVLTEAGEPNPPLPEPAAGSGNAYTPAGMVIVVLGLGTRYSSDYQLVNAPPP